MSMPMSSPRIGCDVYTMDGDRLGTVKEVQGAYFKVDAPMSMDYWLACDCVRGGSGGDRVEVAFAKSELGTYKKDMKDPNDRV
jgi:hypothetical protein